ncbi:MAG: LysR substrate-binding domain-containing protein [Thiobacillaceae bacterium]
MPAPVPATASGKEGRAECEIGVSDPLIVKDVDRMIKAARNGIRIGYMADSYIFDDIREGGLVPLLTDWFPAYSSWYLYYAGCRPIPAPLKWFIEFVREYLNLVARQGHPRRDDWHIIPI